MKDNEYMILKGIEVHSLQISGQKVDIYRIGKSDFASVIIPVREGMPNNLDAVKKQTLTDYEIIIVSGPGAPSSSHARNLGIRFSKTRFIAFLDDDAYPEPDWLEQLLHAYKISGGDIIESRVIAPPSTYFDWNPHLENLQEKVLANFALYPRFVFEKIGLYDESFGRTGGNELDLSIRALKKGLKIRWCSKAIVYHKVNRGRIFKTRRISLRSFFYFLFKHPLYGFLSLLSYFPFTHGFWKHYIYEKPSFVDKRVVLR